MADKLRFDQRYGGASLPTQLSPHELSDELRARVWAVIHQSLEAGKRYDRDSAEYRTTWIWGTFLLKWHIEVDHSPSDEFKREYRPAVAYAKAILFQSDFGRFYTFLEMLAETEDLSAVSAQVAGALIDSRAAWRIIGTEIMPVTSDEQAKAISAALQVVSKHGSEGAKAHLRKSGKAIADGDWAGSVRESVHAVESVARTFESASTLPDALKAMQKSGKAIHPAFAKGLIALYGYTSDESGVRHALLDGGAAAVTENEALFMYSACASFCQYLINTGRS